MATHINAGLYIPKFAVNDEMEVPVLYIDSEVFQIYDKNDDLIAQITYEEMRGIMAIMAAEQEKKHLFIKAKIGNN
ncbi:MAG: hypothetical protein EBU90_21235 [Proteobacteria bacterium]|nr:hypothetical protein [Pseudomonadota bacterium]NBP16064.1 hypothetical protein [bacterium]